MPKEQFIKKRPLGVIPKTLWKEERMLDLAEAIKEHIEAGYYDNLAVRLWCEELITMLKEH